MEKYDVVLLVIGLVAFVALVGWLQLWHIEKLFKGRPSLKNLKRRGVRFTKAQKRQWKARPPDA